MRSTASISARIGSALIRRLTMTQTLAKVQELVDGYPGLYRDVQTYLKERIREVLTGSSHPIVIRIYGQDLEVLRAKAQEVEEKLSGIEGLTDLQVELLTRHPANANRGGPGQGPAVWPQTRRCPAGGGLSGGRRRSRRPSHGQSDVSM